MLIFPRLFVFFVLWASTGFVFAENHASQRHKSAHAKTVGDASSPEYARDHKNSTQVGASDPELDGEINEILTRRLSTMMAYDKIQGLFSADRIVGLGTLIARITIIAIMLIMIWKSIDRFTVRAVASIAARTGKNDEYFNAKAIANTAGPILNSVLRWFTGVIALLIILSQLGLDIMPIIYSFGVFSLAISIGAQTLVKDVISGALTLFEGIIAVGEIAEINGHVGTVEAMSLRAIELRHASGKLQILSFSEITTLINLSRDYAVCKISLPVGHSADIDAVEKTFAEVYESMKNSPEWGQAIKASLDFTGVDSITESAVYAGATILTTPDPFDKVGNEFRRRLHSRARALKIPFPKVSSFSGKD